ncbi:hypothetical protein ACI6QG_00560 [Roseococcus sp. DSY-14]|uniref:hypothetical protein n=1 Tax=Roseococcus sp. DSY-14 TaxID=3369650 RepID=UPI00387B7777
MRPTPWIAAALALAVAAGAAAQEKRKNLPAQPPAPPQAQAPRANEPAQVAALRRLLPGFRFSYAAAAQDGARTRLTGVVMGPAGQEVRAAEMVLEGVTDTGIGQLRATGLSAAWGGLESLELAGFALRGGIPQAERLEATALRVTGPWQGGFARLALRDALPGREAALEVDGLRAAPQDRSVVAEATLRRVTASVTDLQGLVAAVQAGREAPPGRISLLAEALEVRGPAAALGGMDRLALRSENRAGAPATGRLSLEGMALAEGTPAAAWLEPLGYRGLRGDLTLDATQDVARGRLEVGALALAVREVAAAGLSFTLDGVDAANPQRAYANAALVGARLRWADQSLLGRIAAQQAREQRRPEAQVRAEWAAQAAALLPAAMHAPAQRFLRGEARELDLRAAPPRPVALGLLSSKPPADAAGWQRALGLELSAR